MAVALAEAGADIVLIQVRLSRHDQPSALPVSIFSGPSHSPSIQRDQSSTTTAQAIQSLGRGATVYEADLASQTSVSSLAHRILHDDKHDVSILVTSAGIQRRHPSAQFPLDDWSEVLQVNLTSVFTLCRDFGAYMLTRPGPHRGSIINIASLVSFSGGLTVPAYASAKGGIAQLTKALSNEWAGKGVNVNAIAPGYIATDMNEALLKDETRSRQIMERIPMGRWGTPEDFKGVVVWLAGRASAYVTGEVVVV
jgi:2-dehydro-3-deoxy-D-gluconate 5-dehydrogenase